MRFRFHRTEAVMVVVSLAYLCIGAHIGMICLDDGSWVFGAKRILEGEVPYRDFMTITTPAYYYLLALMFKFFGFHLIIERVLSCVFLALLSYLVYLVVRKITDSHVWGVVGLVLSAVYLGNYSHYPGSQPGALFFGLLSVYSLIVFIENKSHRYFFYSGMMAAVSLLFRQDIGVYVFLVASVGVLWLSSKKFYAYVVGFAIIVLPAAVYFLVQTPISDLVYDFIEYPLKIYPNVAGRPYPVNFSSLSEWLAFKSLFDFLWQISAMMPYLLPLLIYPGFFIHLLLNRIHGRATRQQAGVTLIVLLGLLFFNQVRLRADDWHILPALVPAVILFVIFMRRLWSFKSYRIAVRSSVCMLVLLISLEPFVTKAAALVEPGLVPSYLERAKGIFFMKEVVGTEKDPREFLNYQKAIQFVQENAPKGEPIFVGSIRHDRICSADPLFYFLVDRPSATKFHDMHRGYVTQESVQRQIVREIESNKVRYIVLRQMLDAVCSEPNASSQAIGSDYLDRYIRENFVPVQQYGHEFILKKKNDLRDSK